MLKHNKSDLPILVMSGYPLGLDRAETLPDGLDEYIEKPLTISDLASKIKEALEHKNAAA